MELPVRSEFQLEGETSFADDFVRRLKPWGRDRVRLWSFLPHVFEAYARVLHPPHGGPDQGRRGRWSELAQRNGVALGPETSFREVSGLDATDHSRWDIAAPEEGNLGREQLAALVRLLEPFTATPDRCWLAVWDGYGSWGPGSSQVTLTARTSIVPRRLRTRLARRRTLHNVSRRKKHLEPIPRVHTEHRAYFLFTGRLHDVPWFEIGGWHQSPNLWWPADRAWCVVTEIDGYSTYVGGSAACVEAVVASRDLEALEVSSDVAIDPGPY